MTCKVFRVTQDCVGMGRRKEIGSLTYSSPLDGEVAMIGLFYLTFFFLPEDSCMMILSKEEIR